jgi:hypothetical protein
MIRRNGSRREKMEEESGNCDANEKERGSIKHVP